MTIEPIDLAAIKRLIDYVWTLKKQVKTLSSELETTQQQRDELSTQIQQKQSFFDNQIDSLNTIHKTTTQNLEKNNQKKIDELIETHQKEQQSLTQSFEDKLHSAITELQQKNHDLNDTLNQLQRENQAMSSRIRGIQS